MSPEVLTDRQRSVLDFLRQFLRENGYPPTIREIAAHFDMRSPRGVQDHLKALERKGYIRRAKERSRGIEVLKLGDGRENPRSNVVRLPLIGQVAAGAPVLSEENIEEWIEALPLRSY